MSNSSTNMEIDEKMAREVAYLLEPGDIIEAIPYRNSASMITYIAILHKGHGAVNADLRVSIYEQVGKNFQKLWSSTKNIDHLVKRISVEDIDNDGLNEVIINFQSAGTGAHSEGICIFSHNFKRHYNIFEFYNRQEFAGQILPYVSIEPDLPLEVRDHFINHAMKHGLLNHEWVIDWDAPENAIRRWHKDNGPEPNGIITIKFYEGEEFVSACEELTIDSYGIEWRPSFKGPLVGYMKQENKTFIAYSPANFYAWVTSLAVIGPRIWFVTHSGTYYLHSFEYGTLELFSYENIGRIKISGNELLSFKNDRLVVSGKTVSTSELDLAVREARERATRWR